MEQPLNTAPLTLPRWLAPGELLRYAATVCITLAVAYAAYQVNQAMIEHRLNALETKQQKLEDRSVSEKDWNLLVKQLEEIKQDLRELRRELKEAEDRR